MRSRPLQKKIKSLVLAFLALSSTTLAHAKYQTKPVNVINKIVRYGQASWYSEDDPGINPRTANNEIFNDEAMTCAMWGVPFNQQIKITNRDNGKSIIVRVNDRGPHKRFVHKGRIVDLTKNAFRQISSLKHGLIDIQIELL
jgi:rare lipoprotein A